jgi:glycosyltransferase involved in cell wall biosynthesis
LRIACISTSQVPSTTANSIQLMKACAALVEAGHEPTLWLPDGRGDSDWAVLGPHYGIRVRFPIRRLRALAGLRRYDFCLRSVIAGRRAAAELLYVWPYQAAALGSQLGVPTLLEVHDRPPGRMGPRLFRGFLNGKGAVRMLVTTRALRDWLADHYDPARVGGLARVMPNGVDLERYRGLPEPGQARSVLGLPERFTAGYTGHLYSGRGIDLMLTLARELPDLQLLWAGGRPEAVDYWRDRLRREGVENLKLLGFVENERLPIVQAACEVLLMPYEHQIAVSSGGDTAATASPMKLFEYLAAGRAILASDLPVLREVLNEANALLLPPDESAIWKEALERLRKYPERCARLGEQARTDAQRYSWIERARRAVEGLGAEGAGA